MKKYVNFKSNFDKIHFLKNKFEKKFCYYKIFVLNLYQNNKIWYRYFLKQKKQIIYLLISIHLNRHNSFLTKTNS